MPRPAPRVAPASTATAPASDFSAMTGGTRDVDMGMDRRGCRAIREPPDADDSSIRQPLDGKISPSLFTAAASARGR